MIEILTVEFAVLRKQISHPARDLAADGYAAMAVFHPATLHDDVFSRRFQPPSIGVASRFNCDAIVTRVEGTILNQDVATRFRVAAVVVWTMTVNLHVLHDHVSAQHRMNFPHR